MLVAPPSAYKRWELDVALGFHCTEDVAHLKGDRLDGGASEMCGGTGGAEAGDGAAYSNVPVWSAPRPSIAGTNGRRQNQGVDAASERLVQDS